MRKQAQELNASLVRLKERLARKRGRSLRLSIWAIHRLTWEDFRAYVLEIGLREQDLDRNGAVRRIARIHGILNFSSQSMPSHIYSQHIA
jgi:hypothetical protein